jgi:hypothetical protein
LERVELLRAEWASLCRLARFLGLRVRGTAEGNGRKRLVDRIEKKIAELHAEDHRQHAGKGLGGEEIRERGLR